MPAHARHADSDARAVLFDYPGRAAVGTVIPKAQIVARARSRGLRDRLSAQVAEIRWAYKLAPVSLNLAASAEPAEFQVFRVTLKPGTESIAEPLLRAIDQAVPSPILFEVLAGARIRTVAAYKRPNEADSSKEVLGDYLWGDPLPLETPKLSLPVALDMAGLYREMLRRLIPLAAREGESLRDQLDRLARVRTLQRECARLEAQLAREPQFNRKVELNRALREQRLLLARVHG
jgi:hypothetical protein